MPHSLTRRALDYPGFWFVLWLVTLLIGLGLALQSMGCAHPIGQALHSAPPRNGLSSASVVTLLRVRHAEPCTDLPDAPCKYADTYEPACSAFALRGAAGVLLVTAAHCAPQLMGAELRYYAPNGVGHDRARLVARDVTRDLAVLEPLNPGALVPLDRASTPAEGARVMAVSALYNQSAPGELVTELTEGWYETTQTVVHGWSGSPELDAQGRVWGLVAKCPTTAAGQCVAGHTYAVGLGAL